MKDKHIELVGSWSLLLGHAVHKANKSVMRGIGPARQSYTIDLNSILDLRLPWVPDKLKHPLGLVNMSIAGRLKFPSL